MKYIYYRTDGSKEELLREKPLELKELQELVGGYIEFAHLPNGHTLCVNEEGLLNGSEDNPFFTYADLGDPAGLFCHLKGNIVEGQDYSGTEGIEFVGF